MFESILIANRGEIACRVIRTCQRLGVRTIAVFSEADRGALFTRLADQAVEIGPSAARDSYLRGERILEVAQRTRAQALHPGYGFLSENPGFARACAAAGVRFVGPSPEAMQAMGLKDAAKALMQRAGVPVVPGYHGVEQDDAFLLEQAVQIGFPVLIKAVAGGGGKGMRRVDVRAEFLAALASARREAEASFGDARVLIEKYLAKPRHIELQILADAHGNTLHLHERDCSLQRRHQKVVEEAPAPFIDAALRARMGEAAVQAARAVQYEGAGTVEMIADASQGLSHGQFYFMEMNTRLQVEHPVTELITGLDLVEWQLRIAAGERLPLAQADVPLRGHAIEVRVCAEEPAADYAPRTGTLRHVQFPALPFLRVETGVSAGDVVSPFYDSMIAKLVVWGEDRRQAIRRLGLALSQVELAGVQTNLRFLKDAIEQPAFAAGDVHTGFLQQHAAQLFASSPAVQRDTVALSALALLCEREEAARLERSPWADTRAFRVHGPREDQLALAVQGEAHDVAVHFEGAHVRLDFAGNVLLVQQMQLVGRTLHAVIDGRRLQASFVRDGERAYLIHDARTSELRVRPRFQAADEGSATLGAVRSPLPGRILNVFVEPGQRVARGAALVALEAMKMEHTLRASADGVVQTVSVKAHEQVVEGSTLLVLGEPAAAEE